MFHILLYEPEIPANTGNIGRLALATNSVLHIIGQPGFHLDDRNVRRAGLDYWQAVSLERHPNLDTFLALYPNNRLLFFSARAQQPYTAAKYQSNDALVFGSESHGLPKELLERNTENTFVIPMLNNRVRSLNLANAVSIVVYEALRQVGAWEYRADT